jgi:GTP-binding protein HflX
MKLLNVPEIRGNLESLKKSVIDELKALYSIDTGNGDFVPEELASRLADITGRINREIVVYINRKGNILDVGVGDSDTVSLGEVEGRRDKTRLSGVRCIHTHPNGDGRLSAVDINSLITLKLDAMVAIGARNGDVTEVFVALLQAGEKDMSGGADIFGPFDLKSWRLNAFHQLIAERDKSWRESVYNIEADVERAILVGVETASYRMVNGKSAGERSLDELEELAITAGVQVLRKELQKKSVKDAAYYVGRGKIEELSLLRQALNANLIIFDDELSGAQFRNIENVLGVKVIDRTTLILDIFAQRARSSEGKLQVELAQLKYRLPRLIGLGQQLSRLGGGIGTRGPGEKKLEVDRRHIRRRINFLENELKSVGKRRGLMREGRKKNDIPTIALVGYTNAGKSTLMNTLCGVDVFAEDKLFATLDPTARKLTLPGGRDALLIDTVGFIRKLPHELVEAFKSTLEEAVFADALIHVVDASEEEMDERVAVVNDILYSLGAVNKPVMLALNKIDKSAKGTLSLTSAGQRENIYEISAVTGYGLSELLRGIDGILPLQDVEVELFVPYSEGWVNSYIHENGKIIYEEFEEVGIKMKAVINKSKVQRVIEYVV